MKQYYIYDVQKPGEAYLFRDEDDGTITPAIFNTETEALFLCSKMNASSTSTAYNVGCICLVVEETW